MYNSLLLCISEHRDCEGALVLYHRPKSNPLSDLSTTNLTDCFYPPRSKGILKDVELVRIEVMGEGCCWHIRHYDKSTGLQRHDEHLGHNYNASYVGEVDIQQWHTSAEKDPGMFCKYKVFTNFNV